MAPKDVWLEPLLAFILNSLFPYHKSSQKPPVKKVFECLPRFYVS